MPKPSSPDKGMTLEEKRELDEAYGACHSHSNSITLAQITEPYTTEDAQKLNTAFSKAHEHSNKSILDNTSASYTTTDKNSLDSNSSKAHTHSNSSTLSAITAAFTTAMKTVVNNLISGIVSGALSVSGYTKLGERATAIKTLLVEGDTPALGSAGSYAIGVSYLNIVSYTVIVRDGNGVIRLPSYGVMTSYSQYYLTSIGTDSKLYIEIPSTATDVYDCAFTALITYKE